MKNLRIAFIAFVFFIKIAGANQVDRLNPFELGTSDRIVFQKAYEFYKNEQYESSIAILKNLKLADTQTASQYFLLGLNFYKILNYPVAEKYFLEVTLNNSLKEIHWAYYYLGLSQIGLLNYDKALNSFRLALDMIPEGQDLEFDTLLKSSIQITEQRINLIEESQDKINLVLSVGATKDSNILNVKETNQNLEAQTLETTAFLKYSSLYKEKVIEPQLYLAHYYTLDNEFKKNDNLQLADTFRVLTQIPIEIQFQTFKSRTALNLGALYFNNSKNAKELSYTLLSLQQNIFFEFNSKLSAEVQALLGYDQSTLDYLNMADDQTAVKFDLISKLIYKPDWLNKNKYYGAFGIVKNKSDGANADYDKISFLMGYDFWAKIKSKYTINSQIEIIFSDSNYSKSELKRSDDFFELVYKLNYELNLKSILQCHLAYSKQNSTINNFSYEDYRLGIKYIYFMQF